MFLNEKLKTHKYSGKINLWVNPGKSKYYYSKEDYYKRIINQNTDLDSILNTYSKVDDENILETQAEILFSRTLKFGSTTNEVLLKMPNPNYIMENCPLKGCSIHVYRIKVGKFKIKLVLHYYKERLFFYSYMFSRLTDDDKNYLYNIISTKYLQKETGFKLIKSITDNKGNYILIDNHCYFTISYFTKNDGFYEKACKIMNSQKKLEIRREKFHSRELVAML